jgi:hypothetical protein
MSTGSTSAFLEHDISIRNSTNIPLKLLLISFHSSFNEYSALVSFIMLYICHMRYDIVVMNGRTPNHRVKILLSSTIEPMK